MAKKENPAPPAEGADATKATADKAAKGKKGGKPEGAPGKGGGKAAKPENPDFKFIVRIANTDLDGKKKVPLALTGVKGVGHRIAYILVDRSGADRTKRIGDLDDPSIEKLRVEVEEHLGEALPLWMVNRRKDIYTGSSLHLIGTDLDQLARDDLNRLKKIRCFRGVRHDTGQKVRGQRSRSNGRTGLAMGVIKKKEGPSSGGDKEKKE